MTAHVTARADGSLTEWLLRAFALLIYGFAVWRLGYAWWLDTSRITLLLLLITEGYTLALVLLARRASERDLSPLVIIATGYAAFFFVILSAEGTAHIVPEFAGTALQLVGLALQFAAKIALGRSFGLLPAQRGLVLSGPYRIVRHPIYFGYFISHVGFLLANFSWHNTAVFALLYLVQIYRIGREEDVLCSSDDYRRYRKRVRWRLLPFVY